LTYNSSSPEIIKIGQKERCNLIVIDSSNEIYREVAKDACSKVLISSAKIGILNKLFYTCPEKKTANIIKNRAELYNQEIGINPSKIETKQLNTCPNENFPSDSLVIIGKSSYKYYKDKKCNILINRDFKSGKLGRVYIGNKCIEE
jgi:hypothetical protein